MFDPISLSIVAGAASLVAGGVKALMQWLGRKKTSGVTLTVGGNTMQINGSLTPDQIKEIAEAFNRQVSQEKK
jgi:hypothetical protein